MKKRQYARKPAPDTSVMSAGNLLQTRPFQVDNNNQQALQVQKESEALTGGFDLTKQYIFNPPATVPCQPLQAKLTIGQPNDKYEQEADRVAHDVVQQINSAQTAEASPQTLAQRQEETVQMKPLLQKREVLEGGEASPNLELSIKQARGSGQPLDANLQRQMGQAMGADFSGVKVHTDSQADQINQSIQAKAFTTGQDLFFRQGAYRPNSRGGQELIAHELTHVMQQNGGAVRRFITPKSHHTAAKTMPASIQEKSIQLKDSILQRYTIVGRNGIGVGAWEGLDRSQTWRASDDQQMVVKDSDAGENGGEALQYYFATSEVFQSGKKALDGLGSGFSLAQDKSQAVLSPYGSGGRRQLFRVIPINKDQKNPEAPTGTFRNCDENTRHALGMHRSTGENPFRSVGVDSAIFETPVPALDDKGRATVNSIMNILSQHITGTDTVPQLWEGHITLSELVKLTYKNLPEDARRIFSMDIGVNQGASPNVGEGVTVINPMSGVGHFAPAIGRSGSDWVSLENDTDQEGNAEDNLNWYIRMYGSVKMSEDNTVVLQDQTFYGEQKRSDSYGAEPMVMKIVPIEQKPKTSTEGRAMQKETTENLVKSLTSSVVLGSSYVINSSEWHRDFVAKINQQTIDDDTPYLELVLGWKKEYQKAPTLEGFKEKMSRSAARLIDKTVNTLGLIQDHIDTLI